MQVPSQLYRTSLALLTDLYELTMAYAAWKEGIAEREAVFSVAFRPLDPTRRRRIPVGDPGRDLVAPVLRRGALVGARPSLEEARRRARAELDRLHPGLKRFVNPHLHPVGLEEGLFDRRMRLVLQGRERGA